MSQRLTRSRTDERIAGVCGGLAKYFDIDAVLVRVAFVVAAITGGFGLLLYVVLWIVVPLEGPDSSPGRSSAALAIAEQRYARGEISAEEFARIRSDLGAL
jgi:phage shock protein C